MEEVALDDLLGKNAPIMRKYLETHNIQVATHFGDVGRCLTNQNACAKSF